MSSKRIVLLWPSGDILFEGRSVLFASRRSERRQPAEPGDPDAAEIAHAPPSSRRAIAGEFSSAAPESERGLA